MGSQSFDFLGLNAGISGIFGGGDGLAIGFGCGFLKGGISGICIGIELTRNDELEEPLNSIVKNVRCHRWFVTIKLLATVIQ